jgi:hypothetical protein
MGEPLAGTAPVARSWIVVEDPGPWGRDAVADGGLPEAVRTALQRAKTAGAGVLLARHPDRLGRSGAADRHVWVARSAAGGTLLRHAVLEDLDPIAAWDMAALAAGSLPAIGSVTRDPLLLVCTHAKRDQCCAVNGRALLAALHDVATPQQRARIWECSHVGGHRFSPVTLTLPSGTVHGRLDRDRVPRLLADVEAGRVAPAAMRGRSCFPGPMQAADIAVRQAAGVFGCDDVDVLLVRDDRAVPVDLGWAVPTGAVDLEVRHVDGRAWRVTVHHAAGTAAVVSALRPESCGAEPGPVHTWQVSALAETAPWR